MNRPPPIERFLAARQRLASERLDADPRALSRGRKQSFQTRIRMLDPATHRIDLIAARAARRIAEDRT